MTFLKTMELLPFHGFSGYKTYIIGIAMLIYGWHIGDPRIVMEGLGFIFMRQAVAKL